MHMRRLPVVFATVGCTLMGTVGMATIPQNTAVAVTAGAAFQFNPGLALQDNGASTGAAEPSIDIDTPGNIYVTGPEGVPTGGCPFWTVHPGTFNAQGLPYDYDGRFDVDHGAPGGGDCDITHGGRSLLENTADSVAVSSLNLAPNISTNSTQDAGKTFQTPAVPAQGSFAAGADRQWNAADPHLQVYYMSVHDLETDNIQVLTSYDGGMHYVQNSVAIDANTFPAATMNNTAGTMAVNPTTHKIYIPFVAPASAAENAAAQTGDLNEHVVYVAVGDPCAVSCTPGQPLGPISWTDYPVYNTPSPNANVDLDNIFPTITLDAAGNIYVGWSGDAKSSSTNRIYISHAAAKNPAKWSKPIAVDNGSAHSNVFPWLAGGATGKVDVAWYSSHLAGPTGSTCPTGATGSPDDSQGVNNNCFNVWRTSFAQITGATSSSPTITRVYATGVIHNGSVCTQGLNCTTGGGDRTLLDFFDMALDASGGANIAYASDVDSPGTAQIYYTRQCTGRSATRNITINRSCASFIPPTPPPPTKVCGAPASTHSAQVVTDATGESTNPTGAGNSSQTDIKNVKATDDGANVDITMQVSSLTDPATPPNGTSDIYYYVTWTGPDGTQYGVEHDEPEAPGAKTFTAGQYDPSNNQLTTSNTVTGTYTAGTPGTITWVVPKSLIGNPTVPVSTIAQAALGQPYSVVTVGEGALGTGLVYTQPADRGPNAGFGASWSVC